MRSWILCLGIAAFAASALAGPEPVEKSRDARLLDILLEREIITADEYASLKDVNLEAPTRKVDFDAKIDEIVSHGLADEHESDLGYDEGFYINGGDLFSLRLNGWVQARYTYTDFDSDGPGEDNSSFSTPRVRLDFSGHAFDEDVRYRIQIDTDDMSDGGSTVLKDAYIEWGNEDHGYAIRGGQFRVPFGRQALMGRNNLQFVDRADSTEAFDFFRDVGAMLHGSCLDDAIQYSAGFFNGTGEDAVNDGTDHLAAFRLVVNPLGGGFDNFEGDLERTDELGLSLGASYALKNLSEAQGMDFFGAMVEGEQNVIGLDAQFRYLGFSAQGEVFVSTVEEDDDTAFEDIDDNGFYVQAGYFILDDVELAGRYSMRNREDDNLGTDDDTSEVTVGLNYYIAGHGHKIQLDWTQRTFEPDVGDELDDNIVRLQWQLAF